MGIEALAGGLFGLLGAGVQAASASHVQSANAAAQSQLNKETMEFNSAEAKKARKFSAEQSSLDRSFNSAEAIKSRTFNAQQAQAAMDFSSIQSEIARQFEERMANSAHQREVFDLKAAGLNPILSATGGNGAAVPSVPIGSSAMASSSPASHSGIQSAAASVAGLSAYQRKNIVGEFVSTAMEGLRLDNDLRRAKAADLQAQAAKQHAEAHTVEAETGVKAQAASERKIDAEVKRMDADISIAFEDLEIKKALKDANISQLHAKIHELESQVGVNAAMAEKLGLEQNVLKRNLRYGTFLSYYLPADAQEKVSEHLMTFIKDNPNLLHKFNERMSGDLSDQSRGRSVVFDLMSEINSYLKSKGW